MFLIRLFLRYGYAPSLFIFFISSALYIVTSNVNKLWLIGLILMAIVISFVAERIHPYQEIWNREKGDVTRDMTHALINEGMITLSLFLLPVLSKIIPDLGSWPVNWPVWQQLVLAIIVADFGITVTHYASHKSLFLWRFHAVHHSVTRMYGFNGLMKHPVHQAIEMTIGTLPLIILGLPTEVATLLSFAVVIQLLLQHSNVDIRVGPLVYVWAVAPGHRHHHIACATKGDVNFGLFTMFWDHLLGTFVVHRPQPKSDELGISGQPDYPVNYKDQLFKPFESS